MTAANGMTNSDEMSWWLRILAQPDPQPEAHPEPAPIDVVGMDMTEYVRNRERLGIRDSNGILGTDVRPWQETRPVSSSGRARAQGEYR